MVIIYQKFSNVGALAVSAALQVMHDKSICSVKTSVGSSAFRVGYRVLPGRLLDLSNYQPYIINLRFSEHAPLVAEATR